MWGMFALSVLIGALFLYVPGTVLLRAFRVAGVAGLVCAPLISLSLYVIMSILYRAFGVFASWVSIFAPLLTLSVALYFASLLFGRSGPVRIGASLPACGETSSLWSRMRSSEWMLLGLYVVVGVLIAGLFFAVFLGAPDTFVQEYDNVHHLDTARSFVDSGNWSPFGAMPYGTEADVSINPLLDSGYYPTAWSSMVALVASMLGVSIPLAANAVNFLFVAVVFPASMFLLSKALFYDRPGVIAFGSLCVLAFSAFPWMFLLFGPLYPNAAAFSVMPLLVACFVSIFCKGAPKRSRVGAAILFCVGVLCCAFTQPNAVFTAGVFLAPFCIVQAVRLADLIPVASARRQLARVLIALIACLLIFSLWYVLNKAPFLQSAVSHSWPATASKPQAFADAFLLGFRALGTQIVLVAFVLVGALYTLRERRYLWIACSYAISICMYAVSASSDGPFQHLVAGFWYTDSYRMAAMASLFAIPLASLGLWVVARTCQRCGSMIARVSDRNRLSVACAGVVVFVFVLGNYYPGLALPQRDLGVSALGSTVSGLCAATDDRAPTVYDAEERAFVQEVKQIVPDDALILNVPDDGSAFTYGVDGLRVYYRYLRTYGEEDESQESRIIRTKLSEMSTNDGVRSAVDSIGAQYLLMLDKKDVPGERRFLFTYENGRKWKGVESVQDDLPGFDMILSRDDMRLYRITAQQ